MYNGAWKGALSGFAGGIVGSAIGGGWGAFTGGGTASGINTLLNGGDFQQAGMSALLGAGLSYGGYELASYIGWQYSNRQLGNVEISYNQYKTMQADFQRSRFWRKEYGGFLMNDGSVKRFPAEWRHAYGIEPADGTGISIDNEAKALYHTHWDAPGKAILVDSFGNDVSKMSIEELLTATARHDIHSSVTARGHGAYDFVQIDSFVINRYETSFCVGGSKEAITIQDSFFRFFPWFSFLFL